MAARELRIASQDQSKNALGTVPASTRRAPRTFYLIRKIERSVNSNLEKALREFDVTVAQYAAMSRVAGRPNISATELARLQNVTQQTMNVLISGLEAQKLVVRKTNVDNRRELLLSLSAKGKTLLDICDRKVDHVEADFFSVYSKEERSQLHDLLLKFDHRHRVV